MLVYNPLVPHITQHDSWSCLAKSLRWSLSAYGIVVPAGQIEGQMRGALVRPGGYLTDKTGHDLADFVSQEFGSAGLTAEYTPSVGWLQVIRDAGRYPLVIGGTNLHHYASVRGYDPDLQLLLLANSAPSWKHLGQKMTRREFEVYGPLARIRVTTPHMIAEGEQYRVPNLPPPRLRGTYRAVTIGASTLYIPADRGGGASSTTVPRALGNRPSPGARPRRGRRVFHQLLAG